MPNEQNIIPYQFDSNQNREQAAKNGAAGGRASAEARRRRKSLREAAELYLSLPVVDTRAWNKLSRDGVDPEDVNNQMAVIAGLTIKAVKGDAKAAKLLFDLLPSDGKAPLEQVEDDPITRSLKEEAERGLF
jgi:hypothetical protein